MAAVSITNATIVEERILLDGHAHSGTIGRLRSGPTDGDNGIDWRPD